jgi:hypothetical protein
VVRHSSGALKCAFYNEGTADPSTPLRSARDDKLEEDIHALPGEQMLKAKRHPEGWRLH